MGLLEIAGALATAFGLFIAYRTFLTNRRSTQIAEDAAKSDSMKRLKAEESLARQRAEEARQRRIEAEAKPAWPEVSPPATSNDRNVIGRDGDVATLRATLTGTGAAAITPGTSGGAVVRGRGGMGKTTLARYYIQTHRAAYYGIWWLQAQTRTGVIEDLAKLARWVNVAEAGADNTTNAENALAYLQQQKAPWLLVYDNAEHIDDLRDLLPERDNIHILLTSREGNWPQRFIEQPADALPQDQAIELLRQESGRDGDADGAKALVVALDRLPLAIVAAGAWLRDVSESSESFGDYQARLEERIRQNPLPETEYPDSVFASIQLSLDKLSANAAQMMRVFCWLSPDDLWPGLVTGIPNCEVPNPQEFWDDIPDDLMALARDGSAVDKVFAELKSRSLMDSDGQDRWWIHRLTQAVQQSVLRGGPGGAEGFAEAVGVFDGRRGNDGEIPAFAGMTAGMTEKDAGMTVKDAGMTEGNEVRHPGEGRDLLEGESHRRIAAAMLAASYPHRSDFRENWPLCARLDAHVAALAANDPPASAAMEYLLNQASVYLDTQRMDDRALRYDEENLRLTEIRLGPDHKDVGGACNNLAVTYWRLGRMVEAEAMAARAVGISEVANVPESRKAIWTGAHGLMAEMVGRSLTGDAQREKLDLAEQRYEQALEIHERLHGRQSREVAKHLNNLADLHAWQGKWEQAIAGHSESVAIRRKVLDAGDPDVPLSQHNFAYTLLQSGRVHQGHEGQGVLDLLEEALEIREDAFERVGHPSRVGTAGFLASAHWALLALAAEGDADAVGVIPRLDRGISEGLVGDHPDKPGDDGFSAGDDGAPVDGDPGLRRDDGEAGRDDGQSGRDDVESLAGGPRQRGGDDEARGDDAQGGGDDGENNGERIKPSAARALALCETYGLDVEHHKSLADQYVLFARLHAAGQVVPGQMQLQDMVRQVATDGGAA